MPPRHFLRVKLRDVLLLFALFGVILALIAPRFQRSFRQRRVDQMLAAAAAGDAEAVSKAIASGVDLKESDKRGFPIGTAAMAFVFDNDTKKLNLALLDVLLANGADPNATMPLSRAVRAGSADAVRKLLIAGADPVPDSRGQTPLQFCIENALFEPMRALLECWPSEKKDEKRQILGADLHVAIECKQSEELKCKMIRMLLEHHADVEAISYGRTPMDLAVRYSNARVGDLLTEFGAPYGPREATAFNRLDELKRMVEADPEILRRRLEPDYYVEPGQGPTLLGIAVRRGYREMGLYLLEAGAPIDVREYHGYTMLHQAMRGGDPELVKALIERGLDVNATPESPLHFAVYEGNSSLVAVLLQAGAEVDAIDGRGRTPLHAAIMKRDIKLARMLLAGGADPTIADTKGNAPKDEAMRLGDKAIIELLDSMPDPMK